MVYIESCYRYEDHNNYAADHFNATKWINHNQFTFYEYSKVRVVAGTSVVIIASTGSLLASYILVLVVDSLFRVWWVSGGVPALAWLIAIIIITV